MTRQPKHRKPRMSRALHSYYTGLVMSGVLVVFPMVSIWIDRAVTAGLFHI